MRLNEHSFQNAPHKTFLSLSFAILVSLIAEPLTGLIDTAFVAQLGSVPLSALGVGIVALSSTFWVFNFLGVGAQTGVAQALGRRDDASATRVTSIALLMGALLGCLLVLLLLPTTDTLAQLMGASGAVQEEAVRYMQLRLLGAPAILVTFASFGALRGLQDMRTPLWIAITVNALNIALDFLLIFGFAFIPALGVAGAALASSISQWIGAAWALWAVLNRLGFTREIKRRDVGNLFRVGRDIFFRTGLLLLFIAICTRIATQIDSDSGAAHQAIRQIWLFTALFLEAFATTAQSLIGYFIGAQRVDMAKRVAAIGTFWSVLVGSLLGLTMWLIQGIVIDIFVPATAIAIFLPAWWISAISQPLGALAFIADGIHYGTGDYRFLRNVMLCATVGGLIGLWWIDTTTPAALMWIWSVTVLWLVFRGLLGMVRIWPGFGASPFTQVGR